ncbi:MAG: chemotaxis protein CheB [Selenomonadaceae bacterium]|nr:chemotaxis protein CheB [Selenomonadaceae bacterium]
MSKISLIAIGSSTGGTEALARVIPKLMPPIPPIVIVQHIPPKFSKSLADRLDRESLLTVKEGEHGELVLPNHVYIAPGGLHMELRRNREGGLQIRCFVAPPVHSCRPAVDVLFKSVAELVGAEALGVILTGIGHDGTEGLLEMKQKGSPTLGQDEATSVVYGMPKAAFNAGAVDMQIPLDSMALAIMNTVKKFNN